MADGTIIFPGNLALGGTTVPVGVTLQSDGTYSLNTSTDTGSSSTVALQGDLFSGNDWSVDVTLSATANTASSFAIPVNSKGFRIINPSARIRYNLDGSIPTSLSATTATANTGTSYLGQYNSEVSGATTVRLFQRGSIPNTLYFISATASATFTLEFF